MKKAVRLGLTSANNAEIVTIKGYSPDPNNTNNPKPLVAMLPILNIATVGSDSKHPIRAHIAIATLDDSASLRQSAGDYIILIDKETYNKSKAWIGGGNKMVLALIDLITRIFFETGSDMIIMHTDNTIEQLTLGDTDVTAHIATAELYGYETMKKAQEYQHKKILKSEKHGARTLHKAYKKNSSKGAKSARANIPVDILSEEYEEPPKETEDTPIINDPVEGIRDVEFEEVREEAPAGHVEAEVINHGNPNPQGQNHKKKKK